MTGENLVPDGGEQQVAPDEGQQQQPEQQPAPDTGQQQQAPWTSDLEQRFDDPNVRGQVDQYVREQIQPYVTQLEQASVEDRYAKKLWTDFTENPVDTYLAVTREMFGEEAANEAQEFLNSMSEGEEEFDPSFQPEYNENELPPRVLQAVEAWENQSREDAYYDELDRIGEANPDLNLAENETLFHPFVSAAGGDFDAAVEGYRAFLDSAAQSAVAAYEQEFGEAPPVMGSENEQQAVPPVEQQYETLDDALDEFFDEERAGAPPTV